MPAPNRTWSQPSQSKSTVEDPADPVLGWTAQYTLGPTQYQPYAPWAAGYKFVRAVDIVDPTSAPTTSASTTGGTLTAGGGPYVYAYAWGTVKSETAVSSAASGQAVTGSTASITVTVPSLPSWADRTYVYRQISGTLQKIGSTTGTTFVDANAVTSGTVALTTAGGTSLYYEVNH